MRSSDSFSIAIPEGGSSVAEGSPLRQWADEAAFQAFYSETSPKLWSYIRRASGDAALADDLLQEAFYRFLRADLPLEKLQMKAYLYRTASSLLADHWRKLKRERRWWGLEGLWSEKTVENTGRGGDTMRLFERLKPQDQMLLWLAYVEGFDHREVASALRLREKSVRVLLFRARKKLARILTNQGISLKGEL